MYARNASANIEIIYNSTCKLELQRHYLRIFNLNLESECNYELERWVVRITIWDL